MFNPFKKRRQDPDKILKQILAMAEPAFFLFRDASGRLDPRIESDEYVLAYLYGSLMVLFDRLAVDDIPEARGPVLVGFFEGLFPGAGRRPLATCNERASSRDPAFWQTVKLAVVEGANMDSRVPPEEHHISLIPYLMRTYPTAR